MNGERKEHNPEDGANRPQLHPERHTRENHEKHDTNAKCRKSLHTIDKKNQQQKEKEQDNLNPWVHAMQKGIPWEIASDLYVI